MRLLALLGLVLAAAPASAATPSAARLLRLDPGARIGGNTEVATAPGTTVRGVPGRTNFIIALGARERIVGGREHDQLGSRGNRNHVIGGGGDDLLHGGRGDTLDGGRGNDVIVDNEGGAIIRPGAGRNKVLAPGKGDLIVCAPNSTANLIYADHSDTIAPSCRSANATVHYMAAPVARPAQANLSGTGSDNDPYRASCDSVSGSDCPVTFASRSLKGFWANEFVPAYQCPGDYPYLLAQNYAPFGTSLLLGVEVRGLGPIGVSISGERSITGPDGKITYSAGTYSQNLGGASATSWSLGENSYQVVLHCTNDVNRGHATSSGGPGAL